MPRLARLAAPWLISLAIAASGVQAQPLGPTGEGVQGVEIVPGWREADGVHVAAIDLRLDPGWHTYWRSPGSAGLAPHFDWSGSRNLSAVRFEWPQPIVFETYGMRTIGYSERLVLPMLLTPADPAQPIDLHLRMRYGVCLDICIPAESVIAGRLLPDAPPEGTALIGAALASRAHSKAEARAEVSCDIRPTERGADVTARISLDPGLDQPVGVIEYGRGDVWVSDSTTQGPGHDLTVAARLEGPSGRPSAISRAALRVTLVGRDRTVEIEGCGG